MNTMFLRPDTWDICLDSFGNIALASEPYQLQQDVASAARLFLGELWYNTSVGVPYFQQILGKQPSISYVAAQLAIAAKTVPHVVSANAVITGIVGRQVQGQIQFTDDTGVSQVALLSPVPLPVPTPPRGGGGGNNGLPAGATYVYEQNSQVQVGNSDIYVYPSGN